MTQSNSPYSLSDATFKNTYYQYFASVCLFALLLDYLLCIFYSTTHDVVCMVNDEGSLMIAVRTSLLAIFQLFFTCTFYQLCKEL